LSLEENRSYDACKKAILAYFKLDSESYLRSFRTSCKLVDENYKMYKNRLREFFVHYIQSLDIDTFDELADIMLTEQFVNTLPADVKSFVLSHQPKTADESSELADFFNQMSRNTGGQGPGQTQGMGHGQANKAQDDSAQRQASRNFVQNKPNGNGFGQTKTNVPHNEVQKKTLCWICGYPGHKYQECPSRDRQNAGVCSICSCYHPTNMPCNQRATGMYATESLSNMRCQRRTNVRNAMMCLLLQMATDCSQCVIQVI